LRLKTEKEKAEAKERIKDERGFTGKVSPTLIQSKIVPESTFVDPGSP